MNISTDNKKALIIFTCGGLLYWLFKDSSFFGAKKKKDTAADRVPIPKPTLNPKDVKNNQKAKNGFVALTAYINAYNNREPDKVLDDLNREFAKEYQVRVYKRTSDGKFVVSDLSGGIVLINNA